MLKLNFKPKVTHLHAQLKICKCKKDFRASDSVNNDLNFRLQFTHLYEPYFNVYRCEIYTGNLKDM